MNKKTWIYIGIGVAVLLAIVGGIVLWKRTKKDKNSSHEEPPRAGVSTDPIQAALNDPETHVETAINNKRAYKKWLRDVYVRLAKIGEGINDEKWQLKWKTQASHSWRRLHFADLDKKGWDNPEAIRLWYGGWLEGTHDTPEQSILEGRLYEATLNNGYGFITQADALKLFKNGGNATLPNWIDRLPTSFNNDINQGGGRSASSQPQHAN